jgi:hypothetical protein
MTNGKLLPQHAPCKACLHTHTSDVSLVPQSLLLRSRHSGFLVVAGSPHDLFTHCTYSGRVLNEAPSLSAACHQLGKTGGDSRVLRARGDDRFVVLHVCWLRHRAPRCPVQACAGGTGLCHLQCALQLQSHMCSRGAAGFTAGYLHIYTMLQFVLCAGMGRFGPMIYVEAVGPKCRSAWPMTAWAVLCRLQHLVDRLHCIGRRQ